MGATRNTGYLENLIQYDASDNVAIATSVNPSYKVTLGGSLLGTSAVFSSSVTATQGIFSVTQATVSVTNKITSGSIGDTILTDFQSSGSVAYAYIQAKILDNNTVSRHRGELSFFVRKDNASYNQALVIKDDGNVGIGTTSPITRLTIFNGGANTSTNYQFKNISVTSGFFSGYTGTAIQSLLAGYDGVDIYATDIGYGYDNTGYALMFSTNDNLTGNPIERMRITSGGITQLFGTNGAVRLEIRNTDNTGYLAFTEQEVRMWRPNGSGADFTIATQAISGSLGSGAITFNPANVERMRITSGGSVLISTTDSAINSGVGIKLLNDSNRHISAVSADSTNANGETFVMYSTTAAAYRFYVGWGGTIYATSTTISGISDIRLKENIRDINYGLNEILLLKPRTFDWKEGKGKNIKNDRGFIAQEFEQIFPDLIDEWKDKSLDDNTPYKSVRADLIPVLVKAIQEQQAQIEELKSKLS